MTLIAEDLLLLMLDDRSGRLTGTSYPQTVLGGALLIELAISEAVEIGEKPSIWSAARVTAVGRAPDDQQLRAAYDVVAAKPRTAQDLVGRLGKDAQQVLAERLVARGILERVDGKVLGLFPTRRWPTADATREQEVRRALVAVLVQGLEPDPRTGALVALLHATDRAHQVVDHEGLSSREVRRRAKQIAEGAWAAKAVRDAILASTTAITVAASAAATGAAVSG